MPITKFNAKHGLSVGADNTPIIDNLGNINCPSIVTTSVSAVTFVADSFQGTVTTNANLSGEVTSVGNITTIQNDPVINKHLTGYTSTAGTITESDTILSAIEKLNANDATNANLVGMVTSVGNNTTVVTNANLTGGVTSVGNVATVVTNANLTGGVTSVGNVATVVTNANLTGGVTSVGNVATVVTNANLTGEVTSVGNTTTIQNDPVVNKKLTGYSPVVGTISANDSIVGAISKLQGNSTASQNLVGDVTSVGNTTTLTNAPVIAKVLTGFTSGDGEITATDSILTAFNKIDGNDKLKIPLSQKGQPNGVATLDATGIIPSAQLPSYVDDVLEYPNYNVFPSTGQMTGKIYVALDTNKTYRWSGSAYVYITSGAVDSVAGKTGIVDLVKADVGLANVDNTADLDKPVVTHTDNGLMSTLDKIKLDAILGTNTGDVTLNTNSGIVVTGQEIKLGTPSNISPTSVNSVTTDTHTHAMVGFTSGSGTSTGTNTGDVTLDIDNGLQLFDQVLSMGTPTTVSISSQNQVSGNSHTHQLSGVPTGSGTHSGTTTGVNQGDLVLGTDNGLVLTEGTYTTPQSLVMGTPSTLSPTTTNAVTTNTHTHLLSAVVSGSGTHMGTARGTNYGDVTLTSANTGLVLTAGTYDSNQSITMGTPSTLTPTTTNAITNSTHTHLLSAVVSGSGTHMGTSRGTNYGDVTLTTNHGLSLTAGTYDTNQVIGMGTPSDITVSSTNSVTGATHTHALVGFTGTSSGANTGDVTLAATNNGLSLTNQVISLGTPSPISSSTTNSVSLNTHTHSLDSSIPHADGTHASGSWGISVTGSSASCTGTAANVANAITFSNTGGAAIGSTYNGSGARTVDYTTVGAAPASHTHSYQAADADLLSIAGLTGTTGLLRKSAADTWTLDTAAYITAASIPASLPANGGNADTVDGQHFAWSNVSDAPTYLWAANANGSGFLAARAYISVNYANTAGSASANGGNADTVDGLHVSTGVNSSANQIVRTNASGYCDFGWINTVSGVCTGTPARVYCSEDAYIRYYDMTTFANYVRASASGSWGINISGTASVATNFNNGNCSSSGGILSCDVLNSTGASDWLEICYSSGIGVRIGTGANGSLPLYASNLYAAGSAVITTGNIGSQSVNYASSAGNSDTIDSNHISNILTKNSSTSGQGIAYTSQGGWDLQSVGSGAACLSFHRPGAYALNFGLDTDNVLKVGGWSMGAVAHTIIHSGNIGSQSVSYASTAGTASYCTISTGRTDAAWYQAMWTTSGSTSLYSTHMVSINSGGYGGIAFNNNAWTIEGHASYGLYSNTGFYANGGLWDAGNRVCSTTYPRVNSYLYLDNNYGHSIVGVYASTVLQGVYAMGDAYKLTAGGAAGNLYGIAWTHSNQGTNAIAGLSHQALFMTAGVTQTAIGTGIYTIGNITGAKLYNAVYNDIADFIELDEELNTIEFGKVYVRTVDGETRLSNCLMEKGIIGIASDTYGYGLGKKDIGNREIPLAIGGFVLAHCDKEYVTGTPLTCTENGILTEMPLESKALYPERIIATFYRVPKEDTWNETKTNGRFIVKVK